METTLNVTPEKLTETANDFQNKATQVKGIHDEMLTKIRSLSWEGQAAEAYKTKFNALETSMNKIFGMISEHVRDLNDIAQQYSAAETKAASIADSLPPSSLE